MIILPDSLLTLNLRLDLEDLKIPSVNRQYEIGRKNFAAKGFGKKGGRRSRPILRKSTEANAVYARVEELIAKHYSKEVEAFLALFDKKKHMVIVRHYPCFGTRSWSRRDASNSVKLIEDAAAAAVGIDDRYTYSLMSSKLRQDTDFNGEVIFIIMSIVEKSGLVINLSDFEEIWSDYTKQR